VRIGINAMLLTGNYAGVSQSIVRLLKALKRIDRENGYVVFAGRDFEPGELDGGNFKLSKRLFNARRRTLRILWEQFLLPGRLYREHLDMLHCPGYVMPLMRPFMGTKPVIITVYDIIALTRPDLCKKGNLAHFKRFLPKSLAYARRVIVPSEAVKADITARFDKVDAGKIRVIPLAAPDGFRPVGDRAAIEDARRKLNLPERFILYVGNIEPKKNLERVVQSFYAAKMVKKLPHKLVIVGQKGWKYKGVFQNILLHGIQDDVILTNYLPDDLLPFLYSAAEFFIFPSITEGFGLPVLEAMQCGLPVITSNAPALRELAQDACIRVDYDDLKAMRFAIERLAEDKSERKRLRELGLARASQFSWDETARRTLKVYEEVYEEFVEG